MRKFWICLMLSLTTLPAHASSSKAVPEGFRGADKNKDGFVSRQEWKGDKASFVELDSNQDGQISVKEFTQTKHGDHFSEIDRNKNGSLSMTEWRASGPAFDHLDANRNNKIERSEYEQSGRYRKVSFLQIDENQDGKITGKEWIRSHVNNDYFREMDKNKDGELSEAEFNQFYNSVPRATQLFNQLFND